MKIRLSDLLETIDASPHLSSLVLSYMIYSGTGAQKEVGKDQYIDVPVVVKDYNNIKIPVEYEASIRKLMIDFAKYEKDEQSDINKQLNTFIKGEQNEQKEHAQKENGTV